MKVAIWFSKALYPFRKSDSISSTKYPYDRYGMDTGFLYLELMTGDEIPIELIPDSSKVQNLQLHGTSAAKTWK